MKDERQHNGEIGMTDTPRNLARGNTLELGSQSQDMFIAKVAHLRETREGQYKPFTVINFNDDVPLQLEGELNRYRIPSPTDENLPKDVSRVIMRWDGKDRGGHAMVFRNPHYFGRVSDAKPKVAQFMGEAIVDREPMYYDPIALAYFFLEHYSPIFVTRKDKQVAAPPKDRRQMFGVMAFEGDLHAISAENLKRNGGIIRVPLARELSVAGTRQRVFETAECSIDDYKRKMFEGQLRFAMTVTNEANRLWSRDQEEKDKINEFHKIRYRWLIRYGYAEPPAKDKQHWFNEAALTPEMNVDAEGNEIELRRCQNCNAVEPEADTPFCPKCAAPIDIFKTFMGDPERGIRGRVVAEAWLQLLEGDERELAIQELQRRREGFELISSASNGMGPAGQSTAGGGKAVTPRKSPTRGPYKNGSKGPSGKPTGELAGGEGLDAIAPPEEGAAAEQLEEA
jgi:hypothetical protein